MPVSGSDWDRALAATEGRECINPRPFGHAAIARQYLEHSIGFISYSEGCNDDVNKFIWSSAAWNPNFRIEECLLEYSRYFLGSEHASDFAKGWLGLEKNWAGPLKGNASIEETLALWQRLEQGATPPLLRSWRFQQALYRAYFDAYTRRRLLGKKDDSLRVRILELGEGLFQSIHMQLDVAHYQAESVSRGANLATLDAELFGPASTSRVPPGSFYDDLGDPRNRPHLVLEKDAAPDPEFRHSVLIGFLYPDSLGNHYPVAWKRWGETLFDTALKLRYSELDRSASYKIRVVYSGDAHDEKVELSANGAVIHPFVRKPWPPRPLEFAVPPAVTANGEAVFSWTREPGLGGNGRGCQISEVWLIRQ